MWRRPAFQTLSKALDISSATAQVVPDLLKALAILSDSTEKICSWSRRPKTILKIRKKKATFLYVINSSIIYKFPKPNSKFKRFKTIVPAWVLIPLVNHDPTIFSVPQADKKPSWFHYGWLDIIIEVFILNLKFTPLL